MKQKVVVINSLDEKDINEKISEMNKTGWQAHSISVSENTMASGQIHQCFCILFQKEAVTS